jgi:hypothetical protein
MTLAERCEAIEECYEFLLAFAAQGLPDDAGTPAGSQVRELLGGAVTALKGIGEQSAAENVEQRFGQVLARDAESSLAAIEMVLAQRSISSQLIDNLNASIHFRALLTDLFLIDEILTLRQRQTIITA